MRDRDRFGQLAPVAGPETRIDAVVAGVSVVGPVGICGRNGDRECYGAQPVAVGGSPHCDGPAEQAADVAAVPRPDQGVVTGLVFNPVCRSCANPAWCG